MKSKTATIATYTARCIANIIGIAAALAGTANAILDTAAIGTHMFVPTLIAFPAATIWLILLLGRDTFASMYEIAAAMDRD